ncbi:hypothetical protein PIB30_002378 [Stylosanthes scabra]|uniref:Uncharacterized protein n=1 Tax=Stylosanthes scabra TaxID=79078 RepID=A0ABU6V1B1_9FABA|nr:hypothetical protein [Stylosanthes scabra]
MADYREDGRTASDSESQNNSRSRSRGVSDKLPSPRKSRPPPRRSAEPHSRPTHYEFMGLVNGHNGRLDRLEQELAQQREVERKLQDELRWRREAEEKIKKLEEGLKQKWVRQEYQYSDLHPGDPFSEEIMKAEVPKNFKNPDMQLQKSDVPGRSLRRNEVQSLPNNLNQCGTNLVRFPAPEVRHELRRAGQEVSHPVLNSKGKGKARSEPTRSQAKGRRIIESVHGKIQQSLFRNPTTTN